MPRKSRHSNADASQKQDRSLNPWRFPGLVALYVDEDHSLSTHCGPAWLEGCRGE